MKVTKNNNLLEKAKELRRNMTSQEKRLWYDFLQHYPEKIYKQRIIDNYIVDFYCHKARIIIEIDGSHHFTLEGKCYDEARTKIINEYGISVLRFSNWDIDDKFETVCEIIDSTIKQRLENLVI